jgi:hypothetical protein
MHPSRKWPSNAIVLVLIGLLLSIGYFNSNQSKDSISNPTAETNLSNSAPKLLATAVNPANISTPLQIPFQKILTN